MHLILDIWKHSTEVSPLVTHQSKGLISQTRVGHQDWSWDGANEQIYLSVTRRKEIPGWEKLLVGKGLGRENQNRKETARVEVEGVGKVGGARAAVWI